MKTPVVLIAFNRAEATRRVLAAIRSVSPERLLVILDGPRSSHPNDEEKCNEVRSIIEREVDWTCSLEIEKAETNLGCAHRIPSGLNWVFQQTDEAIILEDDCVPDPSFFAFCELGLQKCRNDRRITSVSGSRLTHHSDAEPSDDASLSTYFHCWGWATWRRGWELYDHNLEGWRSRLDPKSIEFLLGGSVQQREFWSKIFDDLNNQKMSSWAYRFMLSSWQHSGYALIPRENLIQNIGFGIESTNTRASETNPCESNSSLNKIEFPLHLQRNYAYDRALRQIHRRPSLFNKGKRKLAHSMKEMGLIR